MQSAVLSRRVGTFTGSNPSAGHHETSLCLTLSTNWTTRCPRCATSSTQTSLTRVRYAQRPPNGSRMGSIRKKCERSLVITEKLSIISINILIRTPPIRVPRNYYILSPGTFCEHSKHLVLQAHSLTTQLNIWMSSIT